ncbi:MAG TPA: CoA transferase [Burkholderiaceae bacterium]|nr:CoA transferase [Burkholderiaceae bacterium]
MLDQTIARAGPTAVRLLADWGANVIKIEPPSSDGSRGSVTGARRGPDDQNLHRNKRGVCIDLKHADGAALFRRLVAHANERGKLRFQPLPAPAPALMTPDRGAAE